MADEKKQTVPVAGPDYADHKQAGPLNKILGKMLTKTKGAGRSSGITKSSTVHVTHRGRPRQGQRKRPGFY
jgi:hypothetical protein